jgi:hypothetical protein
MSKENYDKEQGLKQKLFVMVQRFALSASVDQSLLVCHAQFCSASLFKPTALFLKKRFNKQ